MKVAVVTPSIGQDTLTQCLLSIQKQEYDDIVHYGVQIDNSLQI
jgi:hypothetical protein